MRTWWAVGPAWLRDKLVYALFAAAEALGFLLLWLSNQPAIPGDGAAWTLRGCGFALMVAALALWIRWDTWENNRLTAWRSSPEGVAEIAARRAAVHEVGGIVQDAEARCRLWLFQHPEWPGSRSGLFEFERPAMTGPLIFTEAIVVGGLVAVAAAVGSLWAVGAVDVWEAVTLAAVAVLTGWWMVVQALDNHRASEVVMTSETRLEIRTLTASAIAWWNRNWKWLSLAGFVWALAY